MNALDIDNTQLISFLEEIWKIYQVDFREYGKAHLKRRIRNRMTIAKYKTFQILKEDVLTNKIAFEGLFKDFSINVTELFRDPEFYHQLHQILLAEKQTKDINIWVTACASGEEAFSVLMMLEHFGMGYQKIIATDFNPYIIDFASKGRIDSSKKKEYEKNLSKTDFDINLADYFDDFGSYMELKPEYLSKIEFVTHNLLENFEHNHFDLILCRNVLIYFEKNLQNKVINLLSKSLVPNGLFCLGSKESLRFMEAYSIYYTVDQTHKIYQKKEY